MNRNLSGLTELPAGRNALWTNALKPKRKTRRFLNIASHGRSDYRILLPASPSIIEEKSVADLQSWLKEATGVMLPIVRESATCRLSGTEISIGKTDVLRKTFPSLYRAELKEDGYAIAVNKKRLYLIGGSRHGPLNAVYAFLEENIGFRWYDMASIPGIPDLCISPAPCSCACPTGMF